MSPAIFRDYTAGEGLRRAILVRNAVLRQEQVLRSQPPSPTLPVPSAISLTASQQTFDVVRDDDVDEDPVSLSYPWQISSARSAPISPSQFQSQYIAYDDDSASSSPSSSTSSLEASIIEEREQAWFDDVLSELEAGDDQAGLSHHDQYDAESNIDEDELLASLTEELHLSQSISSNISSFSDLPDLVHSDSENEDDDEELDLSDDGINLLPSASPSPSSKQRYLPSSLPSPSRSSVTTSLQTDTLLQAVENHQASQASLDVSPSKPPSSPLQAFLHVKGISQQQADAHDGILHLLPPVFAFPASAHRSQKPPTIPSVL